MPENAATTNLQVFDNQDDVSTHSQSNSKYYDDDGRLKRTGTKFFLAAFTFIYNIKQLYTTLFYMNYAVYANI